MKTAVAARLLARLDDRARPVDDEGRFLTIRRLLPHLAPDQESAVVGAIQQLAPVWLAGALGLLARHLDADSRAAVLDQARSMVADAVFPGEAWVSIMCLSEQCAAIDDAMPLRSLAAQVARSLHPGFQDEALLSIARTFPLGPDRISLLDEAPAIALERRHHTQAWEIIALLPEPHPPFPPTDFAAVPEAVLGLRLEDRRRLIVNAVLDAACESRPDAVARLIDPDALASSVFGNGFADALAGAVGDALRWWA